MTDFGTLRAFQAQLDRQLIACSVAQVLPVEEALQALDPDGMSPREAMDALYRLKGLLSLP